MVSLNESVYYLLHIDICELLVKAIMPPLGYDFFLLNFTKCCTATEIIFYIVPVQINKFIVIFLLVVNLIEI